MDLWKLFRNAAIAGALLANNEQGIELEAVGEQYQPSVGASGQSHVIRAAQGLTFGGFKLS